MMAVVLARFASSFFSRRGPASPRNGLLGGVEWQKQSAERLGGSAVQVRQRVLQVAMYLCWRVKDGNGTCPLFLEEFLIDFCTSRTSSEINK